MFNNNNYRATPIESLHTILLGPYKYLLKSTIPTLSSAQKEEVLARIRTFNYFGFDVGLIGNVVKYHQSFIGREVWAQMALSIIFPYLSCGDQAVLLSLSKLKASLFVVWALFIHFVHIFRIAYCEYYDPLKKVEWTSICKDFVDNVRHHRPEIEEAECSFDATSSPMYGRTWPNLFF